MVNDTFDEHLRIVPYIRIPSHPVRDRFIESIKIDRLPRD